MIVLQSLRVMAAFGLFLTRLSESRDQLQVADHAGGVIQIVAATLGALVQPVLADMLSLT